MPDLQNTTDDELEAISPKIMQRAAKMERERVTTIQKFGKLSNTDSRTIDGFIQRGVTAEQAQVSMLETWSNRVDGETSRGDVTCSHSESFGGHGDIRQAITDGLLLRSGIKVDKPHAAARDFKNTSIVEIAKMLLRDCGDYGVATPPAIY